MSLFDGAPLTVDELRASLRVRASAGGSIRTVSTSGKVYTVRHRPWAELLGAGPVGKTCGDCHYAVGMNRNKTYWKCGRQIITRGPGTDIRLKDPACRLWHRPGVPMFTIKRDG